MTLGSNRPVQRHLKPMKRLLPSPVRQERRSMTEFLTHSDVDGDRPTDRPTWRQKELCFDRSSASSHPSFARWLGPLGKRYSPRRLGCSRSSVHNGESTARAPAPMDGWGLAWMPMGIVHSQGLLMDCSNANVGLTDLIRLDK